MSAPSRVEPRKRAVSWIAWASVLAILLFAIGEIPYRVKAGAAPPEYSFLGQLDLGQDTSMYLSFIRQAAEGRWLFRNQLTHVEHDPVFFNAQFLLVGRLMAGFDLSIEATWRLWRLLGALSLVLGFAWLAVAALPSRSHRLLAVALFVSGSGFGWLSGLVEWAGLVDFAEPHYLISHSQLDVEAAVHPFVQILLNPNFSLPQGVLLSGLALLVTAERQARAPRYWAAAAVLALAGFMRPYDLIPLWATLPLLELTQSAMEGRIDLRRAGRRTIPLLFTMPALVYHALLFTQHPIFKYWASQGDMTSWAGVGWQLNSLGLVAVAAAVRLALARQYPLSVAQRLLACHAAMIFLLVQAHRVVPWMPFSPQLACPLPAVLMPLAVGLLPLLPASWRRLSPVPAALILAAFASVNALSNGIALRRFTFEIPRSERLYILERQREAFEWLAAHVAPDDIVVSSYLASNRMARFVSARIALGHWSATPRIRQLHPLSQALLRGKLSDRQADRFLSRLGADWLFVDRAERRLDDVDLGRIPGLELAYRNGDQRIYRVRAHRGATGVPAGPRVLQ